MVIDPNPITVKMSDCLEHMKRHSGKLHRFPQGIWAAEGWYMWHGPCYGTPTIEALVRRKIAYFSVYKDGRGNTRYPIEVTLVDKPSASERDEGGAGGTTTISTV
jgi:hypothetical protein